MQEIIKELTNLKDQIELTKKNVSVLEGRKQETLNQLQKEFGLKTIEEAEKKSTSLEKELNTISKEIEKEFAQLKEDYEW